jgi:two-component system NarL family sensor kinase
MSALLEETIASIRELMSELRPPALEEHGLTAALFQYASVFEARTGLPVKVSGPAHRMPLPREIALVLFRIAQEALANASKHSGASQVRLSIEKSPARVSMRIEDDGRGMPANPARRGPDHAGGWGLPEMRERAEAVAGRLQVESSESGTRIVVEVPLPGADQPHPG